MDNNEINEIELNIKNALRFSKFIKMFDNQQVLQKELSDNIQKKISNYIEGNQKYTMEIYNNNIGKFKKSIDDLRHEIQKEYNDLKDIENFFDENGKFLFEVKEVNEVEKDNKITAYSELNKVDNSEKLKTLMEFINNYKLDNDNNEDKFKQLKEALNDSDNREFIKNYEYFYSLCVNAALYTVDLLENNHKEFYNKIAAKIKENGKTVNFQEVAQQLKKLNKEEEEYKELSEDVKNNVQQIIYFFNCFENLFSFANKIRSEITDNKINLFNKKFISNGNFLKLLPNKNLSNDTENDLDILMDEDDFEDMFEGDFKYNISRKVKNAYGWNEFKYNNIEDDTNYSDIRELNRKVFEKINELQAATRDDELQKKVLNIKGNLQTVSEEAEKEINQGIFDDKIIIKKLYEGRPEIEIISNEYGDIEEIVEKYKSYDKTSIEIHRIFNEMTGAYEISKVTGEYYSDLKRTSTKGNLVTFEMSNLFNGVLEFNKYKYNFKNNIYEIKINGNETNSLIQEIEGKFGCSLKPVKIGKDDNLIKHTEQEKEDKSNIDDFLNDNNYDTIEEQDKFTKTKIWKAPPVLENYENFLTSKIEYDNYNVNEILKNTIDDLNSNISYGNKTYTLSDCIEMASKYNRNVEVYNCLFNRLQSVNKNLKLKNNDDDKSIDIGFQYIEGNHYFINNSSYDTIFDNTRFDSDTQSAFNESVNQIQTTLDYFLNDDIFTYEARVNKFEDNCKNKSSEYFKEQKLQWNFDYFMNNLYYAILKKPLVQIDKTKNSITIFDCADFYGYYTDNRNYNIDPEVYMADKFLSYNPLKLYIDSPTNMQYVSINSYSGLVNLRNNLKNLMLNFNDENPEGYLKLNDNYTVSDSLIQRIASEKSNDEKKELLNQIEKLSKLVDNIKFYDYDRLIENKQEKLNNRFKVMEYNKRKQRQNKNNKENSLSI